MRSIESRWKRHLCTVNKSSAKLYKAMRSIGVDHFKIALLEECDNEQLDAREIFWIKHFDSFVNGYNSTAGGAFSCEHSIEWLADMLEDYFRGISYKDLAIKYNVSINHIGELIELNVNNGHRRQDCNLKKHSNKPKKIVMYNRYFEPIKLFETISKAVQWISDNTEYKINKFNGYTYITAACNKGNIAYGYRWQYYEDLIQDNMIFRTRFDLEEYNNGGKAYKKMDNHII